MTDRKFTITIHADRRVGDDVTVTPADDPLTTAYHALFDLKDTLHPREDEEVRYLTYLAIQRVADVIRATGGTIPDRHDREV